MEIFKFRCEKEGLDADAELQKAANNAELKRAAEEEAANAPGDKRKRSTADYQAENQLPASPQRYFSQRQLRRKVVVEHYAHACVSRYMAALKHMHASHQQLGARARYLIFSIF